MDFGGNGVISGPRLPKKNSRSKRDYEALQPFHFILQKPHLSFNLTSSIFVPAKKPSKLNPPALLESGKRLARAQKTAISISAQKSRFEFAGFGINTQALFGVVKP
jgi:hypothetical protein